VAGEEQDGRALGPARLDLRGEGVDPLTKGRKVEIRRAQDLEPRLPERSSHGVRIAHGIEEGRDGSVGAVADHQRNPAIGRERGGEKGTG